MKSSQQENSFLVSLRLFFLKKWLKAKVWGDFDSYLLKILTFPWIAKPIYCLVIRSFSLSLWLSLLSLFLLPSLSILLFFLQICFFSFALGCYFYFLYICVCMCVRARVHVHVLMTMSVEIRRSKASVFLYCFLPYLKLQFYTYLLSYFLCAQVHMWKLEDNFWDMILAFHHVCSRAEWTQVVWLAGRCL